MIEASESGFPLLKLASRRPVILDAGMGTRLIDRGFNPGSEDSSLWNQSHPEAVASIHASDLDSGADAIVTNTFCANRRWLERFHRGGDVFLLNQLATRIARSCAGVERFVIGSMGPFGMGEVEVAREQAEVLVVSGVDALLLETQRYPEVLATVSTLRSEFNLPIIVSLQGWPVEMAEAVKRLEDLGVDAIGENCQGRLEEGLRTAERLGKVTVLPIWIKPSAGLPGMAQESPEMFGKVAGQFIAAGVRFLGGCCGTTEAHVVALRAACYDL